MSSARWRECERERERKSAAMSTRYSPWERATRGQAAAMAAAMQAQQMQQDQLANFGGRVRHWERVPVVLAGQQAPDGQTVGGFQVTKWVATNAPLDAERCEPPSGVEAVREPYKRARSPSPDPDGAPRSRSKAPPRRSSRLSMVPSDELLLDGSAGMDTTTAAMAVDNQTTAMAQPATPAQPPQDPGTTATSAREPPQEAVQPEAEGSGSGLAGSAEPAPTSVEEAPRADPAVEEPKPEPAPVPQPPAEEKRGEDS